MIQELFIKNIALIDTLHVSFRAGFNVLSGETGAGKSIIVDSMNLILGSRGDKNLIRAGEQKAYVEALFNLEGYARLPAVLEECGFQERELVLSRELSENGRNLCRINGRLVSLTVLKSIASALVSIYGQNQNLHLLDERYHLSLIDSFAGDAIDRYKEKVRADYSAYERVKKELETLRAHALEKDRLLDLLQYQINEIERTVLKPGEEEAFLAEKAKLLNAEKIAQGINKAKEALDAEGGALSLLYTACKSMESIAGLDMRYEKLRSALNDAYYSAEDTAYELGDCAEDVVYDEDRLSFIEDRLAILSRLKRKYGSSIEEILAFYGDIVAQKEELEDSEIRLEALKKQAELLLAILKESSVRLTEQRKRFSQSLEERLKAELAELGMQDTVLETEFRGTQFTARGCDEVDFLISVNKGVPPRKLSVVASGGELSRIMLAIENIAAQKEEVGTMIFDEIDTGISGTMAHIVAKKIENIAKERQVICVTHLAQIAAMGDANYYIEKLEKAGVAQTTLREIGGEDLVDEIVRLSGGLKSEAAVKHAKELLQNAARVKKQIL